MMAAQNGTPESSRRVRAVGHGLPRERDSPTNLDVTLGRIARRIEVFTQLTKIQKTDNLPADDKTEQRCFKESQR
jgi:hypothetical protein